LQLLFNQGGRQGRTQGGCTGCTCIPPSPSEHPPPGHVHPPPPQPERLVMRKDESVGNKKKMQVCLSKHNNKLDNNLLTVEPRVSFETSFDSQQPKMEPKLVSALSETKRLFRMFRFFIKTSSFSVSIKPKLTETSPCPVPGRVLSTAARNCPASGIFCPAATCAVFGHDCPTQTCAAV
jgi:hypothetical protein